eukprot:01984.XXX_20302_19876_1 [CDS] Oithona nana genome sequencing.
MKALGGVRPIDVVEPINGDVILAEIRKSKDITLPKSNSEVEQQKRLQEVQNDPKYEFFQPGRFVLLDIPKERPEKESTLKRFAPYIVKNIDTRQKKPLFSLKSMKDVPVRGLFGREDLVPIENP